MSLTAIGVGMAALAVIGGGLGIGFATSSAVKAIAQQPEAHGKIRSTEYFFVDKLAHYFAFKVVTPKDRPFFITLAISFYIICIMCPIMSLIATILFKTPGVQIISVWFMTILFNFPMAFFWQICYCGPFVRWIFGKLFH